MPSAAAADRVWLIEHPTAELNAVVGASKGTIRPIPQLPLDVVPADHPRANDPPQGARVIAHHRPDDIAIAAAIGQFLFETDMFTGPAPGGCDWVDTPGFVSFNDSTGEVCVDTRNLATVPRGFPATLSLSLQLPPRAVFATDSVLAIAIGVAAKRVPVFVAIGNCGALRDPEDTYDLRNPIARLPGIVSVGATVDEDGTALTRTSSVGAAGGAGPTVVANGTNRFQDGVNESSFATAYAAAVAAFITAFLMQLGAVLATRRTGKWHGVPLPIMGYVDAGFAGWDPSQVRPLPMLPFGCGIDVDACRDVLGAAEEHNLALAVRPRPGLVTDLLVRCARRGPGAPHESGAGVVNTANAIRMLAGLTCRELFRLTGYELPANPAFDAILADASSLPLLVEVSMAARLQYGFNFKSHKTIATVRPPQFSPASRVPAPPG